MHLMEAVCFPKHLIILFFVLNECVANETAYFSADLSEIEQSENLVPS